MSGITERDFVLTCVRLTGFAEYDLYGTGMAGLYLSTARDQVGEERFDAFWAALKKALDDPQGLKALSPAHLEVARALTYLWYTGAWPKLAPAAHAALRREKANTEFVAAPAAYTEGLVWRTFHGHPAGAKAPGFGTWAVPPPGIPPLEELQEETAAGPDGAYRVGMEEPVALDDVPHDLLPAFRASRDVPPSEVPAAPEPEAEEQEEIRA
ncbi:hypothetical protein [Nocardiopsis composta]|uniref:Uncharacterized protein n=1 Tax=Nocardiopsis composta TaxID=157465 RepID=A0A7W8QJC3_9ACTN|nr:hypothetical protein [Nocardiopsis composta]MBB5431084.1 hypothetical protein [Nocardiopsis composta]